MKFLSLTLLICLIFINWSFAQTNFSPFLSKEEQKLVYRITNGIDALKNNIVYKDTSIKFASEHKSIQNNHKINSRDSISKIIDSLNNTKPYEINGSIGINSIEDLKNSFGTFSIGARFRISKYKAKPTEIEKNIKRLDPHFVYFEYKTRTALSSDTNALIKTFIFPQLNKQDYVFGYYHQVTNSTNWNFWLPLFEFSLNKYSDKDNKNYFTSEAFQLGVRFHKSFPTTTGTIGRWLMFMPYYKLIHVDSKYRNSYNTLLGETLLPSVFHCAGMELAFGPQNAAFFGNMNYILPKNNEIKSPELIRFVYTVGIRALFSSNTFQL